MTKPVSTRAISPRLKKIWLIGGAVVIALVVTGFALWPRSPLDLSTQDHMTRTGVYAHWKAGDMIVLVRHSERCDRSSNPCLGPQDGITQVGKQTAADVGKSFETLGMTNADVLSSPTTRTTQTAQSMFGTDAVVADWLLSCGPALGREALAHKAASRNLVLVTHSGCIDDIEKKLGFRHPTKSEYTSSVFISVDANGRLTLQGYLNPEGWKTVLAQKK